MDSSSLFETEEDIIALVSSLVSEEVEERTFHILGTNDPERLIRLGFWPANVKMGEPWMTNWMNGMDDITNEFWTLTEVSDMIEIIADIPTWIYKSVERRKRDAIATGSSFALTLYCPEMIYKGSKRPKTDMSLFRSPISRTVRRSDLRGNKLTIEGEEWTVIPVTRYAAGMSKGLYWDERPQDVCGTFYYYEPESTTYLAYKTELRAFNKTEAAAELDIYDDRGEDITNAMLKHSRGPYSRDLIMTRDEAYETFPWRDLDPRVKPDSNYVGEYLELYGQEDVWDQPLCVGASNTGYHVVILENMVGKYQVLTEVLDTRSREDSFASLCYLVD